jgi:DNA-binding transcriptional LysR family regulator
MDKLAKLARRMRLRDLHTLLAVESNGGMRKAADALHLSQPAVSKAIQELESILGVPLFHRKQGGAKLTAHGEVLVRHATALFEELRIGVQELEHISDPGAGEVRCGSMETFNAGLMGAAIERITRLYPRMRIKVQAGESQQLIDHYLRRRMVDFVVARPLALPLPPDMAGEPLFHDSLNVVVGRTHPLAGRRKISLSEVMPESWILSANEALAGSPLAEACERAQLAMPAKVVVTGSVNIRYKLLATGRFVTLMPTSMLRFVRHVMPVLALPIVFPEWQTPTMIVTFRDRTRMGPASQRFVDLVREMAASLSRSP